MFNELSNFYIICISVRAKNENNEVHYNKQDLIIFK